ncbi:hypothetical protein HK097_010644 [Rhizophlyctis rosea]|uniref:Uncharacterized protein n=1 Tax=Rhizophlyctis rosea TaxID=64517 RepID=A0AAD5X0D0_9FUNG|nr:hypothetical protein HK097_010644 [Rhizophlyctis rosea]
MGATGYFARRILAAKMVRRVLFNRRFIIQSKSSKTTSTATSAVDLLNHLSLATSAASSFDNPSTPMSPANDDGNPELELDGGIRSFFVDQAAMYLIRFPGRRFNVWMIPQLKLAVDEYKWKVKEIEREARERVGNPKWKPPAKILEHIGSDRISSRHKEEEWYPEMIRQEQDQKRRRATMKAKEEGGEVINGGYKEDDDDDVWSRKSGAVSDKRPKFDRADEERDGIHKWLHQEDDRRQANADMGIKPNTYFTISMDSFNIEFRKRMAQEHNDPMDLIYENAALENQNDSETRTLRYDFEDYRQDPRNRKRMDQGLPGAQEDDICIVCADIEAKHTCAEIPLPGYHEPESGGGQSHKTDFESHQRSESSSELKRNALPPPATKKAKCRRKHNKSDAHVQELGKQPWAKVVRGKVFQNHNETWTKTHAEKFAKLLQLRNLDDGASFSRLQKDAQEEFDVYETERLENGTLPDEADNTLPSSVKLYMDVVGGKWWHVARQTMRRQAATVPVADKREGESPFYTDVNSTSGKQPLGQDECIVTWNEKAIREGKYQFHKMSNDTLCISCQTPDGQMFTQVLRPNIQMKAAGMETLNCAINWLFDRGYVKFEVEGLRGDFLNAHLCTWIKQVHVKNQPYTIKPAIRVFQDVTQDIFFVVRDLLKTHFPSEFRMLCRLQTVLEEKTGMRFMGGPLPCAAVNLNIQAARHCDCSDHPLGLCAVVCWGGYRGAHLVLENVAAIIEFGCFSIVFFRSNICIHGNTRFIKAQNDWFDGGRRSMVLFTCKRLLQWWENVEGFRLCVKDFYGPEVYGPRKPPKWIDARK